MKKLYMILPLALILCIMVGCQDKEAIAELEEFRAQAEVEEQNIELIRDFLRELDSGNWDLVHEIFADDCKFYSPSDSAPSSRLPVILTGIIDLVFQESGGWVIADYKSDEVGGLEHLQNLLDYYAPQVKLYSRFWVEITGEPVKETGLFFIDLNRWIQIF